MMQRILKGDTSGTIALALADGYNYAGCVVEFRYQGAVRTFRNCEEGQTIQFNFTAAETAVMALGAFPVTVRLMTADGSFFTVNNADVKIEVTDCVADVREGGVIVVEATSGLYGVDDLPERYTTKDIRAKINEIIQRLGGGVAALCLAACVACGSLFGAGVTVQKANLDDIHNDEKVVTGVTFDASGLATTAAVQQAEARAKAHADDAAADKITAGTATNIASRVTSNVVTRAYVEGLGISGGAYSVMSNATGEALVKTLRLTDPSTAKVIAKDNNHNDFTLIGFDGRSGEVLGGQADLGVYSLAIAPGAYAKGIFSIAIGHDATAGSARSVAIGDTSTSGDSSVAIGCDAASGHSSVAIGNRAAAEEDSVALGAGTAVRYDSVAIGGLAAATNLSIALGWYAVASNDLSTVIGSQAHSHGNETVNIGRKNDLDYVFIGDRSVGEIIDTATNATLAAANAYTDAHAGSGGTNITYVYSDTSTNRSDWAGNREQCVSIPPIYFGTGGAIVLEVDGNPEVDGKPVSGNYVYDGKSDNTFWFSRTDGFMIYYDSEPRHGDLDLEYNSTYLGTFAFAPPGVNVPAGGSLGSGTGAVSLDGVYHTLSWNHVREIPGTSRWERVATGITREDADLIATNLANQITVKQDALPYPTNAIPATVLTNADWLSGVNVNGERAAVTNGVAYVHVSSGGTDADEVRGLIDGSFGGGTNAVNELTAHVHSDTNNHPIATIGGVAAAASSSVAALGGTVVEPPVEVDWWQAIVDATPEMRIGAYVVPSGGNWGHMSSDTLAIYDGHVTDYSWKGGDFARYSLVFDGGETTLTYLGGSTGFVRSIGGCYSWDGMTAYVHDDYGCGQYAVNEPFGAVLSGRKSVSAFFGYAGAISRDGLRFLGLSGSDILFYDLSVPNDLTTGRSVGTLHAKAFPGMSDYTCHSFAVSPDGKKLILVNQTANLALISLSAAWNPVNATLVGVKTFGTGNWSSVAFDDRGLLMLGSTGSTSASIHVFWTDPQPVDTRYQTETNGLAVTARLTDLPIVERVVVGIVGGSGTDGETVTNIVRALAYEQDGANEIVSNRWTQTAERGVLPDYTATGAKVGSVGYDALLTYTTNGMLTLPAPARVRVLAVGGGGGGAHGGNYFGRRQTGGAGGGGGGAVETNVTLAAGTYTFTPGAGGAGGQPISGGGHGGATTIAYNGMTIIEVPGGGGGGNYAQSGGAGGCGGGAGGMNTNDVTCAASIGDPGCFGGAPGADSNGFVRLEWVESTVAGRQVVEIDSVTFDQTIATEITLRGMFTATASGWQSPCGFSTEGGSLITRNPSDKFGNDKLGFNLDASKLATAPVTIVWTVGRIDGVNRQTLRVVYQDETEDTASATGTLMPGDIGRPLTLFGVGALAGGLYNFADFRLYGATIRQDGVLKAELVPALMAGGVAGLYDEVTGGFLAPTSSVPLACSRYADQYPGSGGGGMGTMGEGATATAAGRGGDGIASDITGETVYYAGGGGGGSALSGISGGAGGLGGGGSGVTQGTEPAQKAGLDGFGGGGGGGGSGAFENSNGGAGGRGVVIVRIEHIGVVTNTVPYALTTDIPSAEEWQAVKARLAEIEARLNAAGGE